MAKARRRSKAQRIESRLERSLRAQDGQLVEIIRATLDEQERKRFWLRMGCRVGPVAS